MDVIAVVQEVLAVADAVVSEAPLPQWKAGGEAPREAAFDELHDAFESEALRGKHQVDVVGHDDEVVELVAALAAVMLQRFEEEFSVGRDLEETA